VDTEYFTYVEPNDDKQVVFCGSMDWIANVDGLKYFFDEVWPLIREQVPDVSMKVVGRQPPSSLVRRVIARAPEWQFTGYVDDVRDHVPGCGAFVIPLRVGGGTRIKAFEAMAMGCPVVSTSVGIEGLPVEPGKHFLSADTPSDFADAVIRLLRDAELRQEMTQCARKLVETQFSFRVAAKVFEQICLDLIDRRADQSHK
jgi:glycosyltransferase involved in cell wall biosynthesis